MMGTGLVLISQENHKTVNLSQSKQDVLENIVGWDRFECSKLLSTHVVAFVSLFLTGKGVRRIKELP